MAKQTVKDAAPGAGGKAVAFFRSLYDRTRTFFVEVWTELGKVTWPTREDLKVSTKVTMLMLCIMAAIVFAFDLTFARVMLAILSLV